MPGPDDSLPRIACIMGPTGVGKTAIALELAERYGAEIVSADSLQVYRYMDIGSAKPTLEERNRIPHHVIDVVDPDQPFDVSRYRKLAGEAINRLQRLKKRVFIVGGTGLYIRALLGGLIDTPGADDNFRNKLKEEVKKSGRERLYAILKEKDPRTAKVLHPHDVVRIIRALEVLELTGRSILDYQRDHGFRDTQWNCLKIGLCLPRADLDERINMRTERMMAAGFLDEVRRLLAMGYDESMKPMQALGYRHLASAVRGDVEVKKAVMLIKRDTRLFAKRQMTWFAADNSVKWFSPDDVEGISAAMSQFFAD